MSNTRLHSAVLIRNKTLRSPSPPAGGGDRHRRLGDCARTRDGRVAGAFSKMGRANSHRRRAQSCCCARSRTNMGGSFGTARYAHSCDFSDKDFQGICEALAPISAFGFAAENPQRARVRTPENLAQVLSPFSSLHPLRLPPSLHRLLKHWIGARKTESHSDHRLVAFRRRSTRSICAANRRVRRMRAVITHENADLWVAHASRVPAMVSRHRELF